MKRGKQKFFPFSTALNREDRTLATVQNYALRQHRIRASMFPCAREQALSQSQEQIKIIVKELIKVVRDGRTKTKFSKIQ